MKRYVVPNGIIRVKTRRRWLRNPVITEASSFLRYHHSISTPCHNFFIDKYCHIHGNARLLPTSWKLLSRRHLSSTPTETKNNDSEAIFSAQTFLRRLKKLPVEDVAHQFFKHCSVKDNNFDPRLEMVRILESLNDNPQAGEGFVKTIQQLSKNSSSSKEDSSDEGSKKTDNRDPPFEPLREHYEMVLKAWLNFDPPSVKRAQGLLDYMEKNTDLTYDTKFCNLILGGWTKKGNAERAQMFFDKVIRKRTQVDLVSFSNLIEAWSKSKSPLAVSRVESILSYMEKKSDIKPNAECYLLIIECWAKSKKKGSEKRIEALIGFLNQRLLEDSNQIRDDIIKEIQQVAASNLLQVYHNIGNAHRAEEILLEFAKDVRTPPPTIAMCLSVLSTWSKSASSRRAHRAEKLLRLMEIDSEFPQPDTSCYTAVLNCIASSKKPGSAKRAEALLRRMDEKEETKSNLVSLTCVLIAWARSEDLNGHLEAERIFEEIIDRGMHPDRYVYGGLMAAWGRSNDQSALQKVDDYFKRLQCLEDSKPTVVEYTVLIQAYANYVSKHIEDSRELVQRAEGLLAEMLNSEDESLRPNILSYAAILKVIAAARRIPDRGAHANKVLQTMASNSVDIPPYIMNLVNRCNSRVSVQKQSSSSE